MPLHHSRRDILKTSLGLAAGAAFPSFLSLERAIAQAGVMPTSAADIVQAIRDKKVTAVSVVQAAIDRAEKLKDLNTLIFLNKDAALAAARDVDAGKISILTPIGAALIGLSGGQSIEFQTPSGGWRSLTVIAVG